MGLNFFLGEYLVDGEKELNIINFDLKINSLKSLRFKCYKHKHFYLSL